MPSIRPELSEASFRRYEPVMAQAAREGSALIDPAPLRPFTWVSKFREARLGYLQFGYESTLIPSAFDTRRLVARPQTDGKVLVECRGFVAPVAPATPRLPVQSELYCTMQDIHHIIATRHASQAILLTVFPNELAAAQAIANQHQNIFVIRK